jgi:hypothetical protein
MCRRFAFSMYVSLSCLACGSIAASPDVSPRRADESSAAKSKQTSDVEKQHEAASPTVAPRQKTIDDCESELDLGHIEMVKACWPAVNPTAQARPAGSEPECLQYLDGHKRCWDLPESSDREILAN